MRLTCRPRGITYKDNHTIFYTNSILTKFGQGKMTSSERLPYIDTQKRYFDKRVDVFCQPIPGEIESKTNKIVRLSGVGEKTKVLDVGSGVGVLIKHFLEQGVSPTNILGCDLSDEMIAIAKSRYPGVVFWQGDIVDLESDINSIPEHLRNVDRVFFNACFGNMWDQELTLKNALLRLSKSGGIVISHPLGARFVEALKKSDPEIVPHSLPSLENLNSWKKNLEFKVADFIDEKDFYYVYLERL